jgi:hypothetical protein
VIPSYHGGELFAAFHTDPTGEEAYAGCSNVDYLISCSCGHTIEKHDFYDGCTRCVCPRNRVAALEALLESIKATSVVSESPKR